MLPRKFEPEDTTEPHRTPRNLLDYILNQSLNDNFTSLLAKHHISLKVLLNSETEDLEIKDAMFVIGLNQFSTDLIKIASALAEIDLEVFEHKENIKKCNEALRNHDSKDIAERVGLFCKDARSYDDAFPVRHWLPTFNGRPVASIKFLFSNPFQHNPDLTNEENICKILVAFNLHDEFFKNFLNTLYGDGKEGVEFLGKEFGCISSEYKNLKTTITKLSSVIPSLLSEKIVKKIKSKRIFVEKILKKHPATLYLATMSILSYLENSEAM